MYIDICSYSVLKQCQAYISVLQQCHEYICVYIRCSSSARHTFGASTVPWIQVYTFIDNIRSSSSAMNISTKNPRFGPKLGQVGSKLDHVGPSWRHVGAMLAYVGASWGHVGLCWATWRVLSAFLERLGPSWSPKQQFEKPDLTRNGKRRFFIAELFIWFSYGFTWFL